MYPYQKPQLELLLDLIKEANPGMPFPPTAANLRFGTPVAQAVPSGGIADTNILVTGKDPYFGTKVVQYRRINVTQLFRNMMPFKLTIWTGGQLPDRTTLKYLNKTFGTAFLDEDVLGSTRPSGNFTQTIPILATSKCYSGSIDINWQPGPRDVNDFFTATALPGRLFPGGNDFAPGFKPVGEYMCYEVDFSPLSGTFAQIGASGTWNGASALGIPITNFLKANVSPDFKGDQPHTAYGGLNGLSFIRVAIPIATVPEANSQSTVFKNVVAIIAQPNSWFRGKLLMHY